MSIIAERADNTVFLPIVVNPTADVDAAAQPAPSAIRLKTATFTPGQGQSPALPSGLAIVGYLQN